MTARSWRERINQSVIDHLWDQSEQIDQNNMKLAVRCQRLNTYKSLLDGFKASLHPGGGEHTHIQVMPIHTQAYTHIYTQAHAHTGTHARHAHTHTDSPSSCVFVPIMTHLSVLRKLKLPPPSHTSRSCWRSVSWFVRSGPLSDPESEALLTTEQSVWLQDSCAPL